MREEKEENERQITLLEKRITKIKEEKDQELMLVSLQLEKQRLEICNESILNKESKHLLSVAILRKSEVYEKFHDRDAGKIISEDWELLEVLLNKAYDDFTLRLKKLSCYFRYGVEGLYAHENRCSRQPDHTGIEI